MTDRESAIRMILGELIRERRKLKSSAGEGGQIVLEANRLAIVYWQEALAREGGPAADRGYTGLRSRM